MAGGWQGSPRRYRLPDNWFTESLLRASRRAATVAVGSTVRSGGNNESGVDLREGSNVADCSLHT